MKKYLLTGIGTLVVIGGISTWWTLTQKQTQQNTLALTPTQSNLENEIVEIPCDHTFTTVPTDAKPIVSNSQYLKNTQHVYLRRVDEMRVISNADPATFRALSDMDEFGMDAQHVYYAGCELPNANPKTFKHLQNGTYGTDDTNIYWRWRLLSYVNATKFVSLPRGYGKDDKLVYWEGARVKGADPATFQSFEDKTSCNGSCTITAQDKNHTYLLNEIVQ